MTSTTTTPRNRKRSPSYPAISLDVAIARVADLYRSEKQHPTPLVTVVKRWSYKSLNGPASLTVAACKKFGLLEDEGSGAERRAWVTDLAVEIIQNPSQEAREAATREAALRPEVYREMWSQYGPDLPSDSNLQWVLTRERGFTETGAKEFLRAYRQTIHYADLTSSASTTAEAPRAEPSSPDHQDAERSPQREAPRSGTASLAPGYQIPLISGGVVRIEGPFPLTRQDWDHMSTVLNAMQPALVRDLTDGD